MKVCFLLLFFVFFFCYFLFAVVLCVCVRGGGGGCRLMFLIIILYEKIFQEYCQSVKQLGSSPMGLIWVQSDCKSY